MKTKSSSWGGKRIGAGKKPLYQEPTSNMTFRVPVSHKDMVKELVREYLNKLKMPKESAKEQSENEC
jgi:hypothetical protein